MFPASFVHEFHYFARLCKLPSGAVTAFVPAKMRVLTSGILITDSQNDNIVAHVPMLESPTSYKYR